MRKGLVLGIVVFGLLAGCALRSEKAQREVDRQKRVLRAAELRGFRASCVRDYGMITSTPEWRKCVMELDQVNKLANASRRYTPLQEPVYTPPPAPIYIPPLNGYHNNYGAGWY